MSLLFVMLEDAGRELCRYQETGSCDAAHLEPLIDWLEKKGGNASLRSAAYLDEALAAYGIPANECGAAANTMYLTVRAAHRGEKPDPENLRLTCEVLKLWEDIQCAHA